MDLRTLIKEELLKFLKGESKRKLNENNDPIMNQIRSGNRSIGGGALAMALAKKQNEKTQNAKPEYYSPPELEDSYHPKFSDSKVHYYTEGYFDEEKKLSENVSKSKITAESHLTIQLSKVSHLPSKKNYKVDWHLGEEKRYDKNQASSNAWFGNYPLYSNEPRHESEHIFMSWQRFLENINENGIKRPIQIRVEPNGKAFIYEGKHRVEAYKMLGIKEIPSIVKWYGGVEGTEDDNLNEIYKKGALPKNAENLEQFFDEAEGMSFKSDKQKTNWVDDEYNKALSPDEAFKQDEYEIGNIR